MKRSLVFLPLVIVMAFTLGCQDQQALAELEEMKAQAAIEEQNKEIVLESIRSIDAQDFDSLRDLWAEDLSCYLLDMPEPFGREQTIEYIQAFYSAFPDNVHNIHNAIAEGDFVAVMLTNNATHQEDFAGIPATGGTVSFAGMHLVKVLDGVVVDWWLLDDNLGFMQQLGMELQPAAGE
jgi:C-1 hydroxylase